MPTTDADLDGFDPLGAEYDEQGTSLSQVFEDARRRDIHNILKSYTGYYDLFSELLQNSLDAVQARQRMAPQGYTPRIYILIDIPGHRVRVIDNGIGMDLEQFKYCLRPNVSFKRQADLRGHKGVGATFLAYGFSLLKLQSKQGGVGRSVVLRQGRQWAEDTSGTVPRPTFEAMEFAVPELANEESGTCVEILVGQSAGERPRDLGWTGAQSAEQWLNVLRIKTPLGGVYLLTPPFKPQVELTVRASEGTLTTVPTDNPEYYYPHEIPNLKVQSLRDLQAALAAISGDTATKLTRAC